MKGTQALLELLFPTRCAFCHRLSRGAEPVCAACRKELPYTQGEEQRQRFPFVRLCVSPLYYEGDVRRSLLRYKFRGMANYAEIYGKILSKCVDSNAISCDIITWVPLSRGRRRRRGYDQARLIAEKLAAETGLPSAPLLKKTRNNPAQSGIGSPEKRRANVAGVYEALAPEQLRDRQVLLVDDIVTTGATLSACAGVLRAAGAAGVNAAAVARGREKQRKAQNKV